MRSHACHRPSFAAIALGGALLGAGPAWGGTYDVLACAAAPGAVNHSWTARSTSRYLAAYDRCPPSGEPGSGGLIVRNSPQARPLGNAPDAIAEQAFRAPPGASIVALRWSGYRLRRPDARGLAYEVGLRDEHGRWYDAACTGARVCASPATPGASFAYERVTRHSVRIPNRRRLAFVVMCRGAGTGPCDSQSTGDRNSGYVAAGIAVTYARVRISDSTPPEVRRLGGPLWTGDVADAPRAVELIATDNVGIRDVQLLVDGRPAAQSVSQCDPTRPVPCPARRRARLVLGAALPAGTHQLALRVTDAAGNSVTARRTTVVAAGRDRRGDGVGRIAALALLGGLAVVTLLGLLALRRRRARRPVPTMEQARARIAEMAAEGMTSQEIADRFNAERIPALFGRGTWRAGSVDLATRLFPGSPEAGTFVPLSPVRVAEREPTPTPTPAPAPAPAPEPEPEPEQPGGPSAATLYEIVWYRHEEHIAFALQPIDGRAAPWAHYRSSSFEWNEDRDPPASLRAAQRAHGRLKARLDREGWRPAGRGESWFNHRVAPPDKAPGPRGGGRRP